MTFTIILLNNYLFTPFSIVHDIGWRKNVYTIFNDYSQKRNFQVCIHRNVLQKWVTFSLTEIMNRMYTYRHTIIRHSVIMLSIKRRASGSQQPIQTPYPRLLKKVTVNNRK